jgi:peptide/nickel transport system ATP-binding protein
MLPLLEIEGLSIDFASRHQQTNAIKNVSFTVNRGEILALVGESGSGKSVTSLSVLGLLPQPPAIYTHGRILFSENGNESIDLLSASPKSLQKIRGHKIAMIFQEPMSSLNPVMRCGDQVMESLQLHKKLAKAEAKAETIAWFQKVKLPQPEVSFNKYPHQLSGGQKQRVMIAMAMCCQPSLLICDEPTTALDVTVQKSILELILELQRQENMGVIFITHDLGVVKEIADRVLILYKGEIVEQAAAEKIFSQPSHPYTRALIACRPANHPKGERLPVVSDFLENKEPATNKAVSIPDRKEDKILVEVNNLVIQFPVKSSLMGKPLRFFTAVDKASFTINKGETVGLVGESGCGKTTLGRALLQLVKPANGTIRYNGKQIHPAGERELPMLRREVQLVFQDPYSSLNPRLTIADAIMEPMKISGIERNSQKRKERLAMLLERVDLSTKVMSRYPHEFSGGQRQRIVIARALASEPQFLVCDESVSALDVSVQAQVLNLLNELKTDLGLTLLFISHDLSVVRYMSDRMLVMQKGKIVESGNAEDIYHHPQHPYTKELLGSIPSL